MEQAIAFSGLPAFFSARWSDNRSMQRNLAESSQARNWRVGTPIEVTGHRAGGQFFADSINIVLEVNTSNPAKPGSYITIHLTGIGPLDNPFGLTARPRP